MNGNERTATNPITGEGGMWHGRLATAILHFDLQMQLQYVEGLCPIFEN